MRCCSYLLPEGPCRAHPALHATPRPWSTRTPLPPGPGPPTSPYHTTKSFSCGFRDQLPTALFDLFPHPVAPRPRPPEEPGGDPHAAAAYAAAAAAASGRGREEAWEVRLLEPGGCGRLWTSPLLAPGEQALCIKVVYLRNVTTGASVGLGLGLGW